MSEVIILFFDDDPQIYREEAAFLSHEYLTYVNPTQEKIDSVRQSGALSIVVYGAHTTKTYFHLVRRLTESEGRLPLVLITPQDSETELSFMPSASDNIEVDVVRPLNHFSSLQTAVRKALSRAKLRQMEVDLNIVLDLPYLPSINEFVSSSVAFFLRQVKSVKGGWLGIEFLDFLGQRNLSEEKLIRCLYRASTEKFHLNGESEDGKFAGLLPQDFVKKMTEIGDRLKRNSNGVFEQLGWLALPVYHQHDNRLRGFFFAIHNVVISSKPAGLPLQEMRGHTSADSTDSSRNLLLALSRSFATRLWVEESRQLAYMDDLTQLYNQRYLHIILEQEIQRAQRTHAPFSILFMDVDHFKKVNDSYGHVTGSQILIEIGRVIKRCVRQTDFGFRYGGDEYLVMLTGADAKHAQGVAERIRKTVEMTDFEFDGALIKVTISIGVASYPEHASTKSKIIEMADEAMYQGKHKGRNLVRIAS